MAGTWSAVARSMLLESGVEFNDTDIELLGKDVFDVAEELNVTSSQARRELERRIGGLANLPSYMTCLRV